MGKHYRKLWRDGVQRNAHVVLWEEAFGPIPEGFYVDHINGDIHDNRLDNLRLCRPRENSWNMKAHKDNRTGLKGLQWVAKSGLWSAQVMAGGKRYTRAGKDLFEVACWLH